VVSDRDSEACAGFLVTSDRYVGTDIHNCTDRSYITDRHDGAHGNDRADVNYLFNPDDYDPEGDDHDHEPRYGGRRLLTFAGRAVIQQRPSPPAGARSSQ
jgi:hypothetical protein